VRALRFERLGSVNVRAVPEPTPGHGELLVRVTRAGICGTDRHLVSGDYPSAPPVTLGHELEGTVVDMGPGCSVTPGARLAIDPNISCLKCRYCRMGLVAHCVDLRAIGIHRDGGLAELVAVPERQAHELPADLPDGFGALCEPLACCVRAADHAAIRPGDSVAVLGGGVIGQLLCQLARLAGGDVILVTRQAGKRALAESLGATASVDPAISDVVEAISGSSGLVPGGVDVAFEAAGVEATLLQAIAVVRRAGRVVIVGAAPNSITVPISPFDLFARELLVVGSYLNPLTHGRAVQLVASGALDLEPLISKTIDLRDVPDMLSHPPATGEIKVQVGLAGP
jgi:L-iditol 2-dehydrogenase